MFEVLFPERCPACGKPGWPLCASCLRAVPVVTPPLCAGCGRPAEEPLSRCADCLPAAVSAARAPFLYEGPFARAIRSMKFSGWHALAGRLAGAMAEALAQDGAATLRPPPDVATWVPLSRGRLARRGFDQAEVLARALGPALGVPVRGLLRRVRETPPQARRLGPERRRALAGAFEPRSPVPGSVLLVDDVLTTGATASACATALRLGGARRVVVATAARSLHRGVPARCRV